MDWPGIQESASYSTDLKYNLFRYIFYARINEILHSPSQVKVGIIMDAGVGALVYFSKYNVYQVSNGILAKSG